MKTIFFFTILLCLFAVNINAQKADIPQQLKDDQKEIHDHLYNELIPFWDKNAIDSQYGGFLTNFDANGKPVEMTVKYLNSQCRMIWWFSQLNIIMPGEAAKNKAKQGVDFLIKYFWDDANKGWRWKVKRDGSQLDDGKIVYGQSFAIYSLSDYYISTGDKRGLEYAEKTFDLLQKYCADTHYGGYYENMESDWTPAEGEKPADPTETTSYGQNTELVWLMVRAIKAAGESVEPYKPMFRQLLDNAVKYGVDFDKGGIYRDGLRRGGALVLEKEWWQHTESLVGFLEGYELFGEIKYFEAFNAIWNFVNLKMINHEVGEWRRLLDREGNVKDGNIGNEWKVAYHSGRSMIECDKRLKMLLKSNKN